MRNPAEKSVRGSSKIQDSLQDCFEGSRIFGYISRPVGGWVEVYRIIFLLQTLPYIMSFQGNTFTPGSNSYHRAIDLYATSTYGKTRDMKPGEVFQPTSIDDIKFVIQYANEAKKPIAIRTGGHQYSGASST